MLQDLYNAFGPPGSNELMVLQIEDYNYEGNYNNVYNELHGISGTGADEFGNWVEGTSFPIILSNVINSAYQINYYPTIYIVCPDGKITLVSQYSALTMKYFIDNICNTLSGSQNYGRVLETVNNFCVPQGSFAADFKNYGMNDITSAVFNLKKDEIIVSTANYMGSLAQFSTDTIMFDDIAIDAAANYTVEIQNINGVANFNPQFSHANLPFYISVPSGISIQVKIHANDYPSDISWNISGSTGIVASDGPYIVPDATYNYNTNAVIEYNVMLPNIADCYTLNLFSHNGYGWKNSYWATPLTITPGVEIFSGGNLIYSNLDVGNFGTILSVENFLSTNVLSVDEAATDNFTVFPNPTTGVIQINSDKTFEVGIYDIMGKEVFHKAVINKNGVLDISGLGNGVYIAKFIDEYNRETVRKIILDHK